MGADATKRGYRRPECLWESLQANKATSREQTQRGTLNEGTYTFPLSRHLFGVIAEEGFTWGIRLSQLKHSEHGSSPCTASRY